MADLSPSLTCAFLMSIPRNRPALPSIADADHRDLATHRDLDKFPIPAISGATAMHTVSLTSLSPLKEIPAAHKIFLQGPSSTSINDVGAAVPADPITNFRRLFPLSLQQSNPGPP